MRRKNELESFIIYDTLIKFFKADKNIVIIKSFKKDRFI